MTTVTIQHTIPDEAEAYLESSARIRRISRTQLMRRVVEFVLRDQLILSIMDDEDRPSAKTAERRGRVRKHVLTPPVSSAPPVAPSAPQRANSQTFSFRKQQPKTREDLRRELEQAARNTAQLPVE